MDYGAQLKKRYGNLTRRSARYRRQPPFEGSNRQLRGDILKILMKSPHALEPALAKTLGVRHERMRRSLAQLEKEGFVERRGMRLAIASAR
jgi:A/G-specific adenine glycosylase